MKIIGAVIIIGVCWAFGMDFYKSSVNKLNFAKGLYDGLEFLKSEIVFSCNFLSVSLLKAAEFSGDASGFVKTIGTELKEKGVSAERAFEKAEKMLESNTNKEMFLLTKDLFLQLGEKDSEAQEKLLEGYLQKFAIIIKKQNDFCKKEGIMFKKTGAIVGIGIAVLLI